MAAEAFYWAHVNAWDALDRMDRAAATIVAMVAEMLAVQQNRESLG